MAFFLSFFFLMQKLIFHLGFPDSSVGKEPACNAGDLDLILGLGRSLGVRNGNLLHYSCLGNPMYSRAWQATVHGVTNMTERLTYMKESMVDGMIKG